MARHHIVLACIASLGFCHAVAFAQEREESYFVTYSHHMEETGTLEIEESAILGQAGGVNSFLGNWTEFEYGATRWWTTTIYLDTQHTRHEGSLFTGARFENRFALSSGEHFINPVLYIEYEHLNGADKTLKEVVGFDSKDDLSVPNSVARHESEHEIETKLILSSDFKGWNLAENFIGEKNLHRGRWEFGYAAGLSRPVKLSSSGNRCVFCLESLTGGVEVYGGVGTWGDLTFGGTSQYIAPVLKWELPSQTTIQVSPGWGLTDQSARALLRLSISVEIEDFGHKMTRLFRKS